MNTSKERGQKTTQTQQLQTREYPGEEEGDGGVPGVRVNITPQGVRRPRAMSLYGIKWYSGRVRQGSPGPPKGMESYVRVEI
jgi:hypothetical protein